MLRYTNNSDAIIRLASVTSLEACAQECLSDINCRSFQGDATSCLLLRTSPRCARFTGAGLVPAQGNVSLFSHVQREDQTCQLKSALAVSRVLLCLLLFALFALFAFFACFCFCILMLTSSLCAVFPAVWQRLLGCRGLHLPGSDRHGCQRLLHLQTIIPAELSRVGSPVPGRLRRRILWAVLAKHHVL